MPAVEKLAIELIGGEVTVFNLSTPTLIDLVNEVRLTRFAGLAIITLRAKVLLPSVGGESCGIMLDRLRPFSLRKSPILDRRLPLPLFAIPIPEPEPIPPFGVEGARLPGLPWTRSRTLGTCKLLPENVRCPPDSDESSDVKSWFMLMSDSGL